MSSLVLELQSEALSDSINVTRLLHKAIVVATKLSIREFLGWAKSESDGYKEGPTPDYRTFTTQLKARNPFHGWIPVKTQQVELFKQLSMVNLWNPVAEIERWLSTEGDELQVPIPPELERYLDFGGLPACRFLAKSCVSIIPARVRSNILDWSLQLEQQGILGNGMTFSQQEKAQAQHFITNNYYAPQYQNHGSVSAMGDAALQFNISQRE